VQYGERVTSDDQDIYLPSGGRTFRSGINPAACRAPLGAEELPSGLLTHFVGARLAVPVFVGRTFLKKPEKTADRRTVFLTLDDRFSNAVTVSGKMLQKCPVCPHVPGETTGCGGPRRTQNSTNPTPRRNNSTTAGRKDSACFGSWEEMSRRVLRFKFPVAPASGKCRSDDSTCPRASQDNCPINPHFHLFNSAQLACGQF